MKYSLECSITFVDPRRKPGPALPLPLLQFLSFSCSLWQKSCQIIGFGPHSGVNDPFWEILDPPLNNQLIYKDPDFQHSYTGITGPVVSLHHNFIISLRALAVAELQTKKKLHNN